MRVFVITAYPAMCELWRPARPPGCGKVYRKRADVDFQPEAGVRVDPSETWTHRPD